MISTPATINVPLRTDADGVIRIGNTRVTLITIVDSHRAGDTPEEIHESFPTIPLEDIYAVLTYYLHHRTEVDNYIHQVEESAQRLRGQIAAEHPEIFEAQEKFKRLIEERRKSK